MKIENAIIEAADITSNDHGLLSAWVQLTFDGSAQAFGGYSLYLPKGFAHHRILSHAGHFIWRVMEIAEVEKWSHLKGKCVRVERDFSCVKRIGHIIKDEWFDPSEEFKEAE